ncbi:MAG: HypC/HybG/HupF family hydrogenase formation chaperone [Candidatus Thermoplasmatota archaeon]
MCLTIPARVVSVDGNVAALEFRGREVRADARTVPVKPGDYVMVHGGLILHILDPQEVKECLWLLSRAQGEKEP